MGIQKFFKLSLLVAVCLGFFSVQSYAQSSTQVNIVGIPPVLSSPFADNIETNFKTGQYQVIFNYSSFSNQPVDFVFEFTLTRNNRTIIEFESLPQAFSPGSYVFSNFFEEVDFPVTPKDVLNQLDKELQNQVVQSGSIPEGNYSIEITARPNVQQSGINTMPGMSIFTVRYPPPPILVSVPDGANLTLETPTFSWTPVASSMGGLFEYEFLLVEVFRGQTPLQAINSNREHAFETLTGQTTLPYTLQYLPLEEGATYAWQVTARDANGQIPLQNDGESEIYTFTYRDKSASDELKEKISELERINLVPGFAELTNFDRVKVEEQSMKYVLYGEARLNLNFNGFDNVELRTQLNGIEIQKTNLQNPILMGGALEARARGMEDLTGTLSEFIQINNVKWEFGPGFSTDISVRTPDDSVAQTSGVMTIDRTGLRGEVRAVGAPLASIGTHPVQLDVNGITVRYPEMQLRTDTETSFFSEPICENSNVRLSGDTFSLFLSCDSDQVIPMVDYSDNLLMRLNDVRGEISGSWSEQSLDYDLVIGTDIDLNLADNRQCGASSRLNFSSEEGLSVEDIIPNCSVPRPSLNLGFLHTTIENLEFGEILLSEDGEGFDFEIEFDTQLFFPTNPDLSLPKLEDITITRSGIEFPEIEFERNELPVNNSFSIGNFDLNLNRFDLDYFTFPWFDWDGDGPGPWAFSFDAETTLPFSADVPGCFSATELDILNASVSDDGEGRTAVMGTVSADDVASCSWNIGPGFTLDIDNFEGEVAILRELDEFSVRTDFLVDANLTVDQPFSCSADPVIDLDQFVFSLDGGMIGEVSGLNPDCPVQIGPYMAEITDGTLLFDYDEADGQQASLQAEANLQISEEQSASGSFSLNLRTGEFTEADFQIDGPFEWGIPKEDPVLVFTIDEASISGNGMLIEGRQTLTLGEEEIGTTFDGLLIDWNTYEILDGRIIFDHGFNFLAGIEGENNNLQFQAATTDSTLDMSPAVLMELAGTVQVDSLGLRTSGEANASIFYEDLELDELKVEYTDDFAIALEPFGIIEGRVDFNWNSQRIAFGDNSGFYPDLAFFAEEFLPEQIPLPKSDIAYLQIRESEDEELLVNTTRMEDGTYLIETLEGESLNLVLPVLQQPGEAAPPEIQVVLDDLRVNPSTGSYISGNVYATVAADNPLRNHPYLPLTLNEITYTTAENEIGQEIKALYFSGNLKLFDQTLGETPQIDLFIQSDGLLKGGFSMPDANIELPLDGPESRVVVAADSIAGSFNWNPKNKAASTFDIDIGGAFQINDMDGDPLVRSDIGISYNQNDFSLNYFDPSDLLDAIPLDFGFFNIQIPRIESLNISYNEDTGFDYYADLDFLFEIKVEDRTIPFPLNNVEIRSDLGFVIPSQDIHEDSVPGLELPSIDFGIFNLQPLAFRMQRDTLNWNNFSPEDLQDIIPNIDFELTFPQFEESVPALASQSVTLLDASFNEGLLNGDLVSLDFSETPIFFPMGSGAGIHIEQIGGELFSDEGLQRFSIELDGSFEMPEFFTDADEQCPLPDVSVNLTRSAAVEGTITSFTPCGNMNLGPISLAFGDSELEFSVSEDDQTALLSGSASASVLTEQGVQVDAVGNLDLDLITGEIENGSILVDTEFPWHYPSNDSLFTFNVESAELTSSGLVFNAGGSVQVGEGTASVDFNNMTFDLVNLALVEGSATVTNQFAFDVGFGPTNWTLSDPATDPEFSQGVRMTVPENVTIDAAGLSVNGQSGASLYFGEESFDEIMVDFVDTRFRFEPNVGIEEGRADFVLQEEGEEPVRLGWYDSNGFHADNLVAAVPMPDTLALPTKDVAYIVLKDEQGNNLVQSESVEQGLSISTSQPIDLVLAAFENSQGEPYTMSVDFEDIVINAAYEMISGAITVDLEESPLNLTEETDFPLGITQFQYRRENAENHFYADAKLVLPGELEELIISLEDLKLGPNGFADASIALGEYSDQYDSDIEAEVISRQFADGAFGITVRGVEVELGSDPSYKLSAEMTSNLLRSDNGEDEPELTRLFLAAEYDDSDWAFNASAAHIPEQHLPVGNASLILEELDVNITDEHFALLLDARFTVPEVLGDDMQIGIEGLSIGTAGVSLDQINTDAFEGQQLSLFGQQDNLTIGSLGLEITDEYHLVAELNGDFYFLERTFTISELKIGSDGTFELGSGSVNMITEPVDLLGDNLVLTTIEFGVSDGAANLTALADLNLPEPVETSSEVGFSIDHYGAIELINPVIDFTDVSLGVDGVGSINLHQAHFEVNNITEPDFAFYAMADVTFEHGSTVSGKIEFGEIGNVDEWGIRYQYGGALEWRISNDPTFTFENEMFAFTIEAGQAADLPDNEFGISLGVDAALQLDGVGGSIEFEGMILTKSGIEDMGTFVSASLDVGPVTMSLSEFEYSPDGGELELDKAASDDIDQNNMETATETIPTIRHLTFAGEITLDGIFSGSVENFLYYQTENETYLNIQNVDVDILELKLLASLEYQTFGDSGDFRFMVAGSATYSPPSGTDFGMAAMGRIERSGDDFGFAVFVSASLEVPIIPGIITINTLGGGFFYNGVASDFDQVLAISDYEMSSAQNPWEVEDEGYSFALLLQAGAGIVGSAGNYYVNGETFLMITPHWVALDVTATLYMGTPAEIELGMYLGYRWEPHTEVNGSVTARIDNAVAEGEMGLYFQAIWDDSGDGEVIWALNGEIDNFTVLNTIDFDGSLIAGETGFYADLSINASLDVKIVSAKVDFYLELWWMRGQQFGAYTEFSAELSMFKGAFKGGGDFTGALIVGNDLFVYATATVYVDILWVFSGDVTGYVALEDGSIKGGRNGSDEYDQLIDEARDQAENMNAALSEALNAAQEFEAAIEPNKIDEGVIAQAGEAILSNDIVRIFMFNLMLIQEDKLTDSTPELFDNIVSAMQEIDDIPTRGDYNLGALRSTMNQSLDELSDAVNDMYTALDDIEADAVQWQQLAQQSLEGIIQNPVQSRQLEWTGEGEGALPPDFNIEQSVDNANQASLESFRAEVEQLNQQFQDAIVTIGDNIEKIEVGMSPAGADVHGMAMQFEQAINDMEKFYAHYGGLYWDMNRWARISKNVFEAVDFDMEQAVIDQAAAMLATQNIDVDFEGGDYSFISTINGISKFETAPTQVRSAIRSAMLSTIDFDELTNIASWREAVLYYFGSDQTNFQSELNNAEDTFEGYVADNSFQQYFTDWVQRAIEFWYNMPILGYDELISSSENSAVDVYTMYEDPATGLPPLIEAYGDLTEALDDVYSIQHSMHATYEEVLRQYVTWYEDIYGEGEASEYATMQQDIQTKSLPPTITNISVSNDQFNYVNEYTISWNATHPTGNVVENSYYLSAEDYSTDVFVPEFLTVGTNSSATRFLFKREITEGQRNMNIRVRARGPSGITIRRLANRSMNLNPPSQSFNNSLLNYQPVYVQAGTPITTFQDPKPPAKPEIEFPYEDKLTTSYVLQSGGRWGHSNVVQVQNVTYWSNSTGSLTFSAWSMDETYDISQFEFKIGDEQFGNSEMDWTTQTGVPVNGSASNHQQFNVQSLDLSPGEGYYVTVRAINGNGTVSEETSYGPVVVDVENPTAPGLLSSGVSMPAVVKPGTSTYKQATQNEILVSAKRNADSVDPSVPEVTLSWNAAVDNQSGLRRYQVVASTSSSTDVAFAEEDIHYVGTSSNPTVTLAGGDLNFEDEFYFHILAEDRAGNLSEIVTVGPEQIQDPTAPTPPEIIARANSGTLGFYMTKPSSDPDTGIDGYQYVFINTQTGELIMNTSGTISSSGSVTSSSAARLNSGQPGIAHGSTFQQTEMSFRQLPTDNVPKGVPLKLRVVAVNDQGEGSHNAESGIFRHDTTPPVQPSISVNQNGDYLDISVSSIYDPESGVQSAEYRIVDDNGNVIKSWATLLYISNVTYNDRSSSRSWNYGSRNLSNLNVEVRIRNGNAAETVSSAPAVIPIYLMPQVQNYQMIGF